MAFRHHGDGSDRPGKAGRKRLRLHEYSHENDIRYRGPFSYRALMILGWLCIAVTPAALLLRVLLRLNPAASADLGGLSGFFSGASNLSLGLLLIANFAKILNNEGGYKRLLLTSAGAMIGIALLYYLLVYRYVIGTLAAFSTDPQDAEDVLQYLVITLSNAGFRGFNIFVDLFLCNLFMFFLDYRPQKRFPGKKIVLFRLMAVLPILWEVASLAAKIQLANDTIRIPFWAYPLLTMKPPMTFAVFVILVLYIKNRERIFCKKGRRTHEEYRAFLNTNRNSLHFSIFLMIALIVGGLLDGFLLLVYAIFETVRIPTEDIRLLESAAIYFRDAGQAIGLGGTLRMMQLAPFMLLFSYTRKPKGRHLDVLIPVCAVGLSVLMVVESCFQVLRATDLPKVDLIRITQPVLEEYRSGDEESGVLPGGESAQPEDVPAPDTP